MKLLLVVLFQVCLNFVAVAFASPTEAIGPHHPIILIKKNVNPQNQMVAYTKVNSACEFVLDQNQSPLFDFYWLMDGVNYKPVHPRIKNEIRSRLTLDRSHDARTFSASINDLKELDTDLEDARMTVKSRASRQACVVEGFMTLGPSDGNAVVKINSIYTEGRGLLRPKVVSVTIEGISVRTGQPITRTYRGK